MFSVDEYSTNTLKSPLSAYSLGNNAKPSVLDPMLSSTDPFSNTVVARNPRWNNSLYLSHPVTLSLQVNTYSSLLTNLAAGSRLLSHSLDSNFSVVITSPLLNHLVIQNSTLNGSVACAVGTNEAIVVNCPDGPYKLHCSDDAVSIQYRCPYRSSHLKCSSEHTHCTLLYSNDSVGVCHCSGSVNGDTFYTDTFSLTLQHFSDGQFVYHSIKRIQQIATTTQSYIGNVYVGLTAFLVVLFFASGCLNYFEDAHRLSKICVDETVSPVDIRSFLKVLLPLELTTQSWTAVILSKWMGRYSYLLLWLPMADRRRGARTVKLILSVARLMHVLLVVCVTFRFILIDKCSEYHSESECSGHLHDSTHQPDFWSLTTGCEWNADSLSCSCFVDFGNITFISEWLLVTLLITYS